MDQVLIEGLELDTVIGVYDWERSITQRLIVDLTLANSRAGVSSTVKAKRGLGQDGGNCEVCGRYYEKLALHQVKVKHGKAWAVRRDESESEKKKRLAAERRGRASKTGWVAKRQKLQPRDANVSCPHKSV